MKSIRAEIILSFIAFFAVIAANNIVPLDDYERNVTSNPAYYPGSDPYVLSIRRSDPAPYPPPTSAASVDYIVYFSESVTGVDVSDFALTTSGDIAGASVSAVTATVDAAVYTVTVNTGTGNGTIRLDVKASGTGIEDLAGNPLSGGFTAGEVYTIERVPQTLIVTKAADTDDGACDSDCSLREAISIAVDGSIITFDPSLAGTTVALASTLTIDKDLTIDGSNLNPHVQISGNNSVRVFYINDSFNILLSGLDIINGNAGLGTGGGIFNNSNGLSLVNVTLSNNSASDGGGLYNQSGNPTLTDVTFTGNSATSRGGGLYNYSGQLILTNSTFSNNTALNGGGIYNRGALTVAGSTLSGNTATNVGGGIFSDIGSTLTVTDSSLSGNSASAGNSGGGIGISDATVSIAGTTFSNNFAGYGGGFNNSLGDVTITDSTFNDNTAHGGAGIFSDNILSVSNCNFTGNDADTYGGGAIFVLYGTVTISDSTFTTNSATDGGAIYNQNGIVQLPPEIGQNSTVYNWSDGFHNTHERILADNILEGNSKVDGEEDFNNTEEILTITNSTFTGNTAVKGDTESEGAAGAIVNIGTISITDSIFNDNYAEGGGGAIVNSISGSAEVTGSTFTGNSTPEFGGAIYSYSGSLAITNSTFSANMAGLGGAINAGNNEPYSTEESQLTIENSTFSGNTAIVAGGIHAFSGTMTVTGSTFNGNVAESGGGIVNIQAALDITNSTFYGNSSTQEPLGGIYNGGSLTVQNSTFSGNEGGLYNESVGSIILRNTIFANSTAGYDCYNNGGALTSETHNLIEVNGSGEFACGTPVSAADPLLGPLGDNGGPTWTMSLPPGSPAINSGDNAACPAIDQRGISRPQGAACDVGAYERQTIGLIAPSGTLSDWDKRFSWTGLVDATWYLLEVQTSGGTQVHRQWYTSAQTNCSGGTACSVTPAGLNLANGDYKWRIMDYGAYGYGTNSAFRDFSLNLTCYSLSTTLIPAGSGVINASPQNCTGGYTPGSIVELNALAGTGYVFLEWSGDATGTINPVTVTMNANKSVGATMRGNTPIAPLGLLTSWNKAFRWIGLSDATWYLLEVQTSAGTQVHRQWYTSAQTNCSGGTACSVTPEGLYLANGDYKWRVMDYGVYGYGLNSAFKTFTLDLACYTLTVDVNPAGRGAVDIPTQDCTDGYTSGSVVQLTATPATDYLFSNWSGDASGTNNPLPLTMDGNKSISANFTVIPTSSANLFTTYVNHPVDSPHAVGIGDFNNDGLLDAAVTNAAAELKVFYQNQSGTLENETTYAAGSRPEALAVGDLNHDGRDDLVVTSVSDNNISVFLQQSDGSLASRVTYSTGVGPDAVAVGDLNGDGLEDVAVSNWNSAYISIFTQKTDGTLNARVDYPSPQAGYDDIAIGDVNNDGLNDVVKMNGQTYANPDLSVFLQTQAHVLASAVSYSLPGNILGQGIGLGDVTGDGRVDVVMSYGGNTPTAYIAVFAQSVDGSLLPGVSYSAYDVPEPVEVADVNDDGRADVVTVHGGWNAMSVYVQQRDGTLGSFTTYPLRTNSASHYKPQAVAIGDLNQDGMPDTLIANSNYGLDVFYHVPPDEVTPLTPAGTLSDWNNTFRWIGLTDATWYLLEVQTSGGTQVFRQWYTSAQTNCSGGTACSVTPAGLSLANGDYKWRVMDYGAYGYGTNSAFRDFSLDLTLACYTLTTNVNPTGSGTVNASAQNCAGGYTEGSLVQVTAVPNSGYVFDTWSGAASGSGNPVTVTMDGDKSLTANFEATVVLIAPQGEVSGWDNRFSWTGLSNATWYLLEVYNTGGTQVHRQWYTSAQAGCAGGTACAVTLTAGLADGDYRWYILDYGGYGYGAWTPAMEFSLNQ